jgi:hypothetical protein
MDQEQQERFKRAVERKEREASEREDTTSKRGEDEPAAQQHDEIGPRDKSSRHGQVTADKWNQ